MPETPSIDNAKSPACALQENVSNSYGEHWLTRILFLRALGFVYFFAFLSLLNQLPALFYADGILPISDFLTRMAAQERAAKLLLPSLFWIRTDDSFLATCAATGLILSLVVALGFANSVVLALLWGTYLSFVNVGQIFYGYGWEMLLLEAGFLAIFFTPLLDLRVIPRSPPPQPIIFLLRWLIFRVMFGAGLIKYRGDSCWMDLTCLLYHYETQPIPNPFSWYFHHLPAKLHVLGALFNHVVELAAPLTLLCSRRIRHIGGIFIILFQTILILSGNLSFLNYLTIAVAIACFDDCFFRRLFPRQIVRRVEAKYGTKQKTSAVIVTYAVTGVLCCLSIPVAANLLSSRQVMNSSYDPLHLVNTYGAFGSVGRIRNEVILEGTTAEAAEGNTEWIAYEFRCKPGRTDRRPCVVSPYQPRIDWQIWFAAMQTPKMNPWLLRLVQKLLERNENVLGLFEEDPFHGKRPRFIRASLYEYHFTPPGTASDEWWTRSYVREYLPPLSLREQPED